MYIFDSGDIVSALGATVVGILGSIYGHWSPGDALPSMMPGIMVLLPVSLLSLSPSEVVQFSSCLAGWLVSCGWSQC